MLQLDQATYHREKFTLSADFSVKQGQKIGVFGPSGAGKSTLLNLIAGFVFPDYGRVLFNGQDITKWQVSARPFCLLFQDNNLFSHMSIARNVALGLTTAWRLSAVQKDKVEAALERVGLAGLGARRPGELSGGQKNRAALARVLLMSRPLLLLDEPLAALDQPTRQEMLALLSQLAVEQNMTVMLVSHQREDIAQFADQVIEIKSGKAYGPEPLGKDFLK